MKEAETEVCDKSRVSWNFWQRFLATFTGNMKKQQVQNVWFEVMKERYWKSLWKDTDLFISLNIEHVNDKM